jgi:3-hydroxyacyl-CoA dehydrogenase/enoyl-CoA hydratase/3-hydroxybutyryl-CoA epimerase/enoyl-CoA isomerase
MPSMTGRSISLSPLEEGIVELRFDRQEAAINKFDAQTIEELREAVALLAKSSELKGVLVTSAKSSFIVGADVFQLDILFRRPAEEVAKVVAGHSAVFTAFEDLSVPSVVAVNGMALGGGLEFAMAADYRVGESTAQIGLPEVSLGIFPGYGGTVRLPRLMECAAAISWIISGKPQPAAKALEAGVLDKVVEPVSLRAEALAKLQEAIASGAWRDQRERRRGPVAGFDPLCLADLKEEAKRSARHLPAGLAAVELIEVSATMKRDDALALETARFIPIATSRTAAALIQNFINDQHLKKRAKGFVQQARAVKRAAILGAGIMGGGIAYTSAAKGVPVLMKDISQGALDLGMKEADRLLTRQTGQGRLTEEKAAAIRTGIEPRLDYQGFEGVDLVVEAVVENMAVKNAVLAEVEKLVRPGTVIVSNTSSLRIDALARSIGRPEDFAGMHFFNPVPVMPLVEVIKGPETSDRTAATVAGYAVAMGKTPVIVRDCPGFLVNRILISNFVGFLMLLRDGADYREVDRAMEGLGWPMGPAYLLDVIGLDTAAHVIDFITAGYGARMAVDFPNAVKLLVEQGRLGQKNGVGFYRYEPDAKGRLAKQVDPIAADILGGASRKFGDEEIIDRLMLPLIHEAALCLADGIADSAAEIDMAIQMGISFPRHLGGPLKYADLLGLKSVAGKGEQLAALGPLYETPDAIKRGGLFYG